MPQRSGRPRKNGVEPEYSIRAVERAIAVLNSFSVDAPELSLKEITNRTGLSKPTVFRILSTLERHQYVAVDSAPGRYRLGSRILERGGVMYSSLTLRRAARSHLDRLQSETGATVLVGALMDDQIVFVDKRDTAGPLRIAADIGWRKGPHFGMLGMILMAFETPNEVERLLSKFPLTADTRFSITDQGRFLARLGEIRSRGYVVEFNEAIEGVGGVAAPIWSYDGRVVAAVGVALPVSDASDEKISQAVASVKECARGISLGMGHKETPVM